MIPVHNHSHFSALDGYSTPKEIAKTVNDLGLGGAFLTDHGTVAGFSDFAEAMAEKKLFAGFGMEAYQARWSRRWKRNENDPDAKPFRANEDSFHLVLLATTPEGYRNLLRLSHKSNSEGFYYKPRVDWELLKAHREGILATTACMGSLVNQRLMEDDLSPLDQLIEIFGDDLFVELHTYDSELQRALNQELVSLGKDRGLGFVYANDAHYALPEQYEAHEWMLCAQMNEKRDAVKGRKVGKEIEAFMPDDPTHHHPPCLYIMDKDDVKDRLLSHLPRAVVDEAISTSDELRRRCERGGLAGLPAKPRSGVRPKLAKVPPEWSRDERGYAEHELERLVSDGLVRLYGGGDPASVSGEALERATEEIDAIAENDLAGYFLVVRDYIEWAKTQGIMVGPGRGSVGGSILAYALGISCVDPLRYGLSFARFWNPERAKGNLPDIDTDFEKQHRRTMIAKIREEYGGDDHVLLIGNHITLGPKQSIQKAAAVVLDPVPYAEINAITKEIERTDHVYAGQRLDWEELFELPREKLPDGWGDVILETREKVLRMMEPYKGLYETASALQGRLSTYGVHPSAVVISPADLPSYLPGRSADVAGQEREMVTQADFRQVEEAGFAKFDFLAVKTLDVLKRAAMLSGDFETEEEAVRFFWEKDFHQLDEEYYRLVWEGHTLGLFQIDEHQNPRKYGRLIKPANVNDLAAIVALNNPGPVRSGAADEYIRRRRGEEPVRYPHKILESILADTYGVFLYQEQVMAFFRALGYSDAEADEIRKILSKRLYDKMDEEFEKRYLPYATERGLSKAEAEKLWRLIVTFSLYGFNKAHAIAYAMVLSWTIYAKHCWPTEFIMAGIEHADDREKIASYVREARRTGVSVLPPDVNRSGEVISKGGPGEILYGLRDIKGIGAASARWVKENAPYGSPEELMALIKETSKPPCNMGHLRTLISVGALDSFGYRLGECGQCGGKGRWKPDPEKRKYENCPGCSGTGMTRVEIPDEAKKAQAEEELLGVMLTDPVPRQLLEKHAARIEKLPNLDEIEDWDEEQIKVAGVVKEVKTFKTRRNNWDGGNKQMARVSVELGGRSATFVAFPDAYESYGFVLRPGTLAEFTLGWDGKRDKGANMRKAFKLT